MVRTHFEHRLYLLQDNLLELGSMVDKTLHQAVEALKRHDLILSQTVLSRGQGICQKRMEVEKEGFALVASYNPLERTLRLISSVVAIAGDLDYMGHRARGLARINQLITNYALPKPMIEINRMAEKCSTLLNLALDAFLSQDENLARSIALDDEQVNNLYDAIYQELTNLAHSPDTAQAHYLLWAIQNLEQFGDQIVNICERVVFIATGNNVHLHHCQSSHIPLKLSANLELEW